MTMECMASVRNQRDRERKPTPRWKNGKYQQVVDEVIRCERRPCSRSGLKKRLHFYFG